jgi:hypothetical protein
MLRAFLVSLLLSMSVMVCSRTVRAEDASEKPLDVATAYEELRTTLTVESSHLGYAGTPSHNARAFRALLADPKAGALFRKLLREGTAAGRVYALSGLFFTEPNAFPSELDKLIEQGGMVRTMSGCLVRDEDVTEVLKGAPWFERRIVVRAGQSLDDWFKAHESGQGDVAGGYYPLMLAGDGRVAPRDGF